MQSTQKTSVSPKSLAVSERSVTALPPFVTFATGAQLLIDEALVESITPDGLRYIARSATDWPFGEGSGQHPYVMVSGVRTMETGVFLTYFRNKPSRGGRGLKKGDRVRRPSRGSSLP